MERLISDEERIRRAEDVLERRRNMEPIVKINDSDSQKKHFKVKKILVQLLVCMCIYCGLYYTKNTQNDNIKSVMDNIKNVLDYDVNFKEIYQLVCLKLDDFDKKFDNNDMESNQEDEEKKQNQKEQVNSESDGKENSDENQLNDAENEVGLIFRLGRLKSTDESSDDMGIGGESDETIITENMVLTDEEQMMVDSQYIKENFNLINPLEIGIITSGFGSRESSQIVSANHKGIDLGASTGSIIQCASEGTVIEASAEGDFGLHLKIQKDDVIMIYGHCSELLVDEGDIVSQGQPIAKVGSTGKATGPHLHFEVRRDGRAVNPQLLLDFK